MAMKPEGEARSTNNLIQSPSNSTTLCNRSLLVKLTFHQLAKKFPAFYGNQEFITVSTTACYFPLPWTRRIQTMPTSYFLAGHFNITLRSTPRYGSNIFSSGFRTKTQYAPLLFPIHATCPAYLIFIDLQLVKEFPAFHGTQRLITALTSVRHLSLSWASPIQSIYPHPTFWRSILILSTHLRLGLPTGLFPFGFPTKNLYTPLSSPIRATCPAHLILLDFITRTILGEQYKSFSSSLCNLLHSPVTSFPHYLINDTIFGKKSYWT